MRNKYCLGGFELPLRIEFPNINREKCWVVDKKERIVRKFSHWLLAEKFIAKCLIEYEI
ncbi:MAG: hypothetical protein Q7R95_11355 [bacterium]|nr:hypothetical protein [bacterium]